jgi:thioredoxin reductase (NADPH)
MATKVDLSSQPYKVWIDDEKEVQANAIIVATGASAKWLGIESEQRLNGYGVSACAVCDGFFFRGKEVAVVGGGNSAVEEAMFLTNFAKRVHLVHRRDGLRADRTNQRRLFENPKVELHWNKAVADVLATDDGMGVRGIALLDTKTGDASELPIDGLFVAIGHDPATSLFRGQLDMDEGGYIRVTPGTTATSVPGVFAAGDVTDPVYRQAITSAGAGCMAALDAERFLAHAHIAEPVAEAAE